MPYAAALLTAAREKARGERIWMVWAKARVRGESICSERGQARFRFREFPFE